MNTRVVIKSDGGHLTASAGEVDITVGDSVTFEADGAGVLLCFASETAAVLSPSPAEAASIDAGSSVSYTFGKAGPGRYPVLVMKSGSAPPAIIDFEGGTDRPQLAITIPSGRPEPGVINDD